MPDNSLRHSPSEAKDLLNAYCKEHHLWLGTYASYHGRNYLSYFRKYGVSKDAFTNVCQLDPEFTVTCQGDMDQYLVQHELTARWLPAYLHVYELVAQLYPHFSWEIGEATKKKGGKSVTKPVVTFRNYPTILDYPKIGRMFHPTLFDLVTQNVKVDPAYHTPPRKPDVNSKARRRPRRRDRLGGSPCWAHP